LESENQDQMNESSAEKIEYDKQKKMI